MIKILWLLVVLTTTARAADQPSATNDFLFIDNGEVRLGVKKSSGAGIAWFSESKSDRNVINHWDRGRLIQQSYYGEHDGSLWDDKPWTWNPVQGGDWRGNPAKVLELTSKTDSLYARSQAKHWASGAELSEVVFEEWITLTGKLAHVRFKMTYSGTVEHPERDHEIPAVFLEPDLDNLALYTGDKPWTGGTVSESKPGWPNESRKMTEHWAAYVGKDGWGAAAYVPLATRLTCYRFGDGHADHGSCSYFAPLIKFAITPGKAFEYDLYLGLGRVDELRQRFSELNGARAATKPKKP